MLAEVVLAIGTPKYYSVLYEQMCKAYRACQIVIQSYAGAGHEIQLLAAQSHDGDHCFGRIGDYVTRLHRVDPFRDELVPAAEQRMVIKAIDAEDMGRSEYQMRLFSQAQLRGKLSLIIRGPRGAVVMSVYRHVQSAPFSADDLSLMTETAPVLAASLERHCSFAQQSDWTLERLTEVFSGLDRPKRLSEREAAVCAHMLLGYSNLAMSLNLDLSIHSVSTYRRRAYAKLGVTSLSELFALVMKSGRGPTSKAVRTTAQMQALPVPCAVPGPRSMPLDAGGWPLASP